MKYTARFLAPALALAAVVLASLACGGGASPTQPVVNTAPPPAASPTPPSSAATATTPAQQPSPTVEPPTPTTAANAGPGEIVVQGGFETRFVPTSLVAAQLADQVTIALFTADQATGVTLFVPADIQPGTYPIGDLFNLADASITARFDSLQNGKVNSYESISGTLVLGETGSSFSGSFTFSAVKTPDGSPAATVDGNFGGVSLGQ